MDTQRLCYFLILLTQLNGESLFRVSPGGDGFKPAGLWGGNLEREHNGEGEDLFTHGYQSLNTSYGSYYGIDIQYVSYDPIGKRTLMVVADPDGSEDSTNQAIALGYLCKDAQVPLDATFQNFRLHDNGHPYLMESDCGFKCGWGPFALYDGQVYFVFSAVLGQSYVDLTRHIQIRVLEGCEDIIDSIRNRGIGDQVFDFPILECSQLIHTIYSEIYSKPNPRPKVWAASEMKIEKIGTEFHFFTQLIDTYLVEPELHLIHVANNETYTLARTQISSIYTGNLRTKGLGALDYKDGVLCWTSGESLQCSLYGLGGENPYILPLMESGDALAADICLTGSLVQDELKRTLTGVAISETTDTLAVYFGCYADIPATGGVGFIRISNHGLNKELFTVRSGSTKIYGGNLFISDNLDEGCLYTTTKRPSEGTIRPQTVEPPPRSSLEGEAGGSSSCHSSVIMLGFSLILSYFASPIG